MCVCAYVYIKSDSSNNLDQGNYMCVGVQNWIFPTISSNKQVYREYYSDLSNGTYLKERVLRIALYICKLSAHFCDVCWAH